MKKRQIPLPDGRIVGLAEAAQEAGLSVGTLRYRLDTRGLPIDRAMATGTLTASQAGRLGRKAHGFRATKAR